MDSTNPETLKPHVGDQLLIFLQQQPDNRVPVTDLPKQFCDPDVLTICDADRLIEFGTRNHCYVGPKKTLHVEDRWNFDSITGPNLKPVHKILAETLGDKGDERIRLHVQLTSEGIIRVARLNTNQLAKDENSKLTTQVPRFLLETKVGEILTKSPQAPLREVANETGWSVGTIQKLKMWGYNQQRLKIAKRDRTEPSAFLLKEFMVGTKTRQNEQDSLIDERTAEIEAKVGKYRQTHPDASLEEIAIQLHLNIKDVNAAIQQEDYEYRKY